VSTYVLTLLVVVGSIAGVAYIALRDLAQPATPAPRGDDAAEGAVAAVEDEEPEPVEPEPVEPEPGEPEPAEEPEVLTWAHHPLPARPVVSPPVPVRRVARPAAVRAAPVVRELPDTAPVSVAVLVPRDGEVLEPVRGRRVRSGLTLVVLWTTLGAVAAGAVGGAVLLLSLALRRAAGVE
jgi:hypothetical protein